LLPLPLHAGVGGSASSALAAVAIPVDGAVAAGTSASRGASPPHAGSLLFPLFLGGLLAQSPYPWAVGSDDLADALLADSVQGGQLGLGPSL
jgi:hypothetical protein